MKFEHKVFNLFWHTLTVGIFEVMYVVEEISLVLSFFFSRIYPNLSR